MSAALLLGQLSSNASIYFFTPLEIIPKVAGFVYPPARGTCVTLGLKRFQMRSKLSSNKKEDLISTGGSKDQFGNSSGQISR
jgi:hypothetical protein